MKKIYFIIIQLLVSFSLFAQTKSINTETSKIKWIGREITTKIHYGSLKFLDGNISISENQVKGEVIVDMESLNVEDLSGGSKQRLEGHLKSDDFFSVDKHHLTSVWLAIIRLSRMACFACWVHQRAMDNPQRLITTSIGLSCGGI